MNVDVDDDWTQTAFFEKRHSRGDIVDCAEPATACTSGVVLARRDGDRPYFGSIPDFAKPGKGYAISGVSKDSPSAKGGLQGLTATAIAAKG
jgi:hypothetical protein